MTIWFLAPPKHCARLPVAVAPAYTYCAMAVEPTKPTALISGSFKIASTDSLSPFTTFKMPGGRPASRNSSAMRMGHDGSRSDGFRMNALPTAMAGAHFHKGIMAGKLNGVIPATTPKAWRMEYISMPGPAASVNSPFTKCGTPHANSATSTPRCKSPRASGMVLPCSREISSANSSLCLLASSKNFIMTRARNCGFLAAHAGWAAAAFSTAARSSAVVARATLACTSPVLGS